MGVGWGGACQCLLTRNNAIISDTKNGVESSFSIVDSLRVLMAVLDMITMSLRENACTVYVSVHL